MKYVLYYAVLRFLNRLHDMTGQLIQWHTSKNWERVRRK